MTVEPYARAVATTPHLALSPTQTERYGARLGIDIGGALPDLPGLRALHVAHLERVPFENLDIAFGNGVTHDQLASVEKITGDGSREPRGGWCFELNGALALLLDAIGYTVRLLGAAVLFDGPTQLIDHLLLEVDSPLMAPHLVDVGFGDSFDLPLALNTSEPQDGGSGVFELIGSPQGTTLTRHADGVPAALFRFKRVAHAFDDFAAIAASLQSDPAKHWATKPFATRRLTDAERGEIPGPSGVQRVTLTGDRLKIERGDVVDEQRVERGRWHSVLSDWFALTAVGSWPTPP